jgi:hypothetical protein
MIPKKIHYCWLSGEKLPSLVKECIKTWKKVMPDYEIVLWDKTKFDVNSVQFVSEAYNLRKWAFAADYIRLYAVWREGGIYLDSDVIVKKRFDEFLQYGFFTSLEFGPEFQSEYTNSLFLNNDGSLKNTVPEPVHHLGLQAAVFGGIKGHSFLRECMNWYENNHYILPDGQLREFAKGIAPDIYAFHAQKYGFRYGRGLENLKENMVIFPYTVFPNGIQYASKKAFAIHCGEGGWYNKKNFLNFLTRNSFLRRLIGKQSFIEEIIEQIDSGFFLKKCFAISSSKIFYSCRAKGYLDILFISSGMIIVRGWIFISKNKYNNKCKRFVALIGHENAYIFETQNIRRTDVNNEQPGEYNIEFCGLEDRLDMKNIPAGQYTVAIGIRKKKSDEIAFFDTGKGISI